MKGRQNMWEPWYLMIMNNLNKVEYKFYNNVISHYNDIMFFHLGYQHDGNAKVGVTIYLRAWAQIKTLFGSYGRIVHQPLDDVVILNPDEPPKNLALKC
jgi:hypothetical protein